MSEISGAENPFPSLERQTCLFYSYYRTSSF